jgi:hypothetical protein
VRIERSLDFWLPVFQAPECQPAHCGLEIKEDALEAFITNPWVRPIAGQNGGYLFVKKDDYGLIWELHSLFKRPGWGREAAAVGKQALKLMFADGMHLLFTYEIKGLPTPPISYGWEKASEEYARTSIGEGRIWLLTKAAWEQSPAHRYARV